MADKEKELTAGKILADFKIAYSNNKNLFAAADEDLEFLAGDQWKATDVATLDSANVRALTFNIIRPNIQLLTGLESQNRSDFLAYPEGEEDSIKAEIATKLLKNVMKTSDGNYISSDQFVEGCSIGFSFVEPYIDYTYDMLYGQMKFKKLDYSQIFPGKHKEYDMSDAPYICKLTPKLCKDELLILFPDAEKEIEDMESGNIAVDGLDISIEVVKENDDYGTEKDVDELTETEQKSFDLLEYYYKKYVDHYYIADKKLGKLKEVENKSEADNYVQAQTLMDGGLVTSAVITRRIPEIWIAAVVGDKLIDDRKCEFYPKWRTYPIFPMWGYKLSSSITNKEYQIQGVVRMAKDPQREINKRKTQELRHLNQSLNSGIMAEEDSLIDRDKWETEGAKSGVVLEYKKGAPKPEKILPTPLSQGHAQLAEENMQLMKQILGINTDLLAMNESQASGKAINIRQKQGLVMVQSLFDNFARTKRIWGKFILSQLGEIYDIDTAVKVMGDAYIKENFSRPVMTQDVDPMTGQPIQKPQLDPNTGELMTEVDPQALAMMFQSVLNDTSLGVYDVAIGEGTNNETVKYGNFQMLMEMRQAGMAVPDDILIAQSMISNADKEKIKAAVEEQKRMMMAQAQQSEVKNKLGGKSDEQ